jgi:hypothetical protein
MVAVWQNGMACSSCCHEIRHWGWLQGLEELEEAAAAATLTAGVGPVPEDDMVIGRDGEAGLEAGEAELEEEIEVAPDAAVAGSEPSGSTALPRSKRQRTEAEFAKAIKQEDQDAGPGGKAKKKRK